MADFTSHVFVCTYTENSADQRHCGDMGGKAVRHRFNQLLMEHQLFTRVNITNVECTSQHRLCNGSQGNVIVYGPNSELGGVWYIASADDVEEIVTEHLMNGRVVERLRNRQMSTTFS